MFKNTHKKLITIAGAGSLYTDCTHTQFEYESKSCPQKLRDVSYFIRQGVEFFKKETSFPWIIICPSRKFDLNGGWTQKYLIETNEEVIENNDHESYVTYDDLAMAMVDCIKTTKYDHQVITVATVSKINE